MKIFNHSIMTCTHERVEGNYLYCGRGLGITSPEDIIQLHPALRSEWAAITAHYDRMGLSHSHRVLWDDSFDEVERHPERELSVFYFGDTGDRHSPHSDWCRRLNYNWWSVVDFINSKNNFMQLAHELDVPVPQTLCYETKAQVDLDDCCFYPCYFKPAISVDGMGIVRCADDQALAQALDQAPENLPLQIQAEVVTSTFLNLQYQVTEQGVKRLAATEQVLEGCSHSGNRYPTVHQPWEQVEPMAQWMTAKGMRGIFAFDVAVVPGTSAPLYLAFECNPRYNGASYPTEIAHKLQIQAWSSETFATQYRTLTDLDLSDLEYCAQTGTGVILVNWGTILIGKLAVLLAGSLEQQADLRLALRQRL
jgi:hypothetical protein